MILRQSATDSYSLTFSVKAKYRNISNVHLGLNEIYVWFLLHTKKIG